MFQSFSDDPVVRTQCFHCCGQGSAPGQKMCILQPMKCDVTGYGCKVQCCKDQYCIGTWNVRSMNQGKLEVVKRWQD